MDKKEDKIISNWTDDDWLAAILILSLLDIGKDWQDFCKEIKDDSRFFPTTDLLNRIDKMKDTASLTIQQAAIFYRARTMDRFFLYENKKELKQLEELIVKYHPELNGKKYEDMSYIFYNPFFEITSPIMDGLKELLKRRKTFWGYNAKGSDAPPKERASAGRANPAGVSYLYMAEDEKTAIMEVRPLIGQDVSVAKIKIDTEIKVFDLTKRDQDFTNIEDPFLYDAISRAFSEPFTGNSLDYLPTQCLCEYIRKLGFDGIKYYSAMNNSKYNVVLFDTKEKEKDCRKYHVMSSKVYTIRGYSVDALQVAPLFS